VQNADFGISHPSMDNQQKKEHLMKSGIECLHAFRNCQHKYSFLRKLPFIASAIQEILEAQKAVCFECRRLFKIGKCLHKCSK
jgi:hypothetical protein